MSWKVEWDCDKALFSLKANDQQTGLSLSIDGEGALSLTLDQWRSLVSAFHAAETLFKPRLTHPANQGLPWSQKEDEELVGVLSKGFSVDHIASTMGRSEGGIRSRLVRLGFVNDPRSTP